MKQSESTIQSNIAKLLMLHNYLVIRFNSGAFSADYKNGTSRYIRYYIIENNGKSAGVSDLIAFKNGKAFFLEIKTKTGKQTINQIAFEELAKRFNMEYHILRSTQDAGEFINKHKEV